MDEYTKEQFGIALKELKSALEVLDSSNIHVVVEWLDLAQNSMYPVIEFGDEKLSAYLCRVGDMFDTMSEAARVQESLSKLIDDMEVLLEIKKPVN